MKAKTKSDNIFDKSDVEIVSESFNFSALQGAKVLVTGANGTVGSLCVKSLVANGVNVVALIRNQDKANRIFQQELADKNLASKIAFLVQDIRTPISADLKVDYIIHCASETASKAFVEHPVETILTTLDGTKNILEFAKTCKKKYCEIGILLKNFVMKTLIHWIFNFILVQLFRSHFFVTEKQGEHCAPHEGRDGAKLLLCRGCGERHFDNFNEGRDWRGLQCGKPE